MLASLISEGVSGQVVSVHKALEIMGQLRTRSVNSASKMRCADPWGMAHSPPPHPIRFKHLRRPLSTTRSTAGVPFLSPLPVPLLEPIAASVITIARS
jgi:hypothetical protein